MLVPLLGATARHRRPQEKYLAMVEEPAEEGEWWLDERTRTAAEKALNLSDHLTFTVYEARPLRLSRAQARRSLWHGSAGEVAKDSERGAARL